MNEGDTCMCIYGRCDNGMGDSKRVNRKECGLVAKYFQKQYGTKSQEGNYAIMKAVNLSNKKRQ